MEEEEDDAPIYQKALSSQKRRDIENWLASNETASTSEDSNKSTSPVLCTKRPATSPVIGSCKRKRFQKVSKNKLKQLNDKETPAEQPTKELHVDNNVADTKSIIKPHREMKIQTHTSNFEKKNLNHSFEIEESDSDIEYRKGFDICLKTENTSPLVNSQFIESIASEDKSITPKDFVQESSSSDEKTVSDLIEDIPTQTELEISHQQEAHLSQNITNPSSNSSETVNLDEVRVLPDVSDTVSYDFIQQYSNLSTNESRNESNLSTYIPQIFPNKTKTRKKKPKKGSLLELLMTTIQKETSNVRILRHQVIRKPNEALRLQFVIFKIIKELPMLNGNQIFKCLIIDDKHGLLNDYIKNRSVDRVTVMTVPEISGTIDRNNVNLKIFPPWDIIDTQEIVLHVSKFVLVSEALSDRNKSYNCSVNKRQLKRYEEFDCPCIKEMQISVRCNSKFEECSVNTYNEVFSYK